MKYQAVTQAVLNIGCDFQNLQPYHFEPEKQKTAFNAVTFLIKWEKKANPSLYKIVLETWVVRREKLTVSAAKFYVKLI